MNSDTLWDAYEDGNATPREALRALSAELLQVLGRKAQVAQDEALLRERISLAVAFVDAQTLVINDLTIELRGPSVRHTYDPKRIGALAQRLVDEGNPVAAEIQACRVPQAVAGGLVITPTKAAKARIADAATSAATLPNIMAQGIRTHNHTQER